MDSRFDGEVIVFWGIGITALVNLRKMYQDIESAIEKYEIIFCDNNPSTWGTVFRGKKVVAPSELGQYNIAAVVILSVYKEEIKKQLWKELGISLDIVFDWNEFLGEILVKVTYAKRYKGNDISVKNSLFTEKIVVYTAIAGEYDDLKEPDFVCEDIDYVCFTNNKKIKSDIWEIEYIEECIMSNIELARRLKILPHKLFPEYKTSIWVDGAFKIKKDIREYITKYGKAGPILCFPHSSRKCIYEEQAACINVGNSSVEDIIGQVSSYYSEGYPFYNGLYETGCIVRNHNDEMCIKIMNEWMEEIEKYSFRDQISFPYICWKNNFTPDICDVSIYNNEWLTYNRHIFR